MQVASASVARTVLPAAPSARPFATALSMYTEAPDLEVSLEEFERRALDRLEVLKAIEAARQRGLKSEDVVRAVQPVHDRKLPLNSADDLRNDSMSHYILRLAYSRTDELQRWFLTQEANLFRYRFDTEGSTSVNAFMRAAKLDYEEADEEEVEGLRDDLMAVLHTQAPRGTPLPKPFFKIPFEQAISMVGARRVFLRDGFAYVARENMVSIVVERFRTTLQQAMATARKALPHVLRDARIAPLLVHMSKQGAQNQYMPRTGKAGAVSIADLDSIARDSFPLCMRTMHFKLRETHHLRYEARAQYGLFLKGIGVSLDDSMKFWRAEFTKVKTPEEFEKQYAYNIRHLYGKEGKRTDYTPRSCVTIITGTPPGASEHHGCPFRHFDETHLRAKLLQMGTPSEQVGELMERVRAKDYQIACRLHWLAMHPGGDDRGVGNHPNAWFDASRKYHKEKAGVTDADAPAAAAAAAAAAPPTAGAGAGSGGAGDMDEEELAAVIAAADAAAAAADS